MEDLSGRALEQYVAESGCDVSDGYSSNTYLILYLPMATDWMAHHHLCSTLHDRLFSRSLDFGPLDTLSDSGIIAVSSTDIFAAGGKPSLYPGH